MEQQSDILIKGMVCNRCRTFIMEGIRLLGYDVVDAHLGRLTVHSQLVKSDYERIGQFLGENGFAMLSNRYQVIASRVKDIINETFDNPDIFNAKFKFSSLIQDELNMNYSSISEVFTETEGITIEKYIIETRLNKVKELLAYTRLSLSEIAHTTGFSSINYLSRQFKELTGLPPSHFRSIRATKLG